MFYVFYAPFALAVREGKRTGASFLEFIISPLFLHSVEVVWDKCWGLVVGQVWTWSSLEEDIHICAMGFPKFLNYRLAQRLSYHITSASWTMHCGATNLRCNYGDFLRFSNVFNYITTLLQFWNLRPTWPLPVSTIPPTSYANSFV